MKIRNFCKNNYFVKETKECMKGYVCRLDKGKVVYPNACTKGSDKNCWRVKFNKGEKWIKLKFTVLVEPKEGDPFVATEIKFLVLDDVGKFADILRCMAQRVPVNVTFSSDQLKLNINTGEIKE